MSPSQVAFHLSDSPHMQHQILPIPKNEYSKYKHNMLQANFFPLFAVSASVFKRNWNAHKNSLNLGWLTES